MDRDNIFVTLPKGTAWLAAPESSLRAPEDGDDTTMRDASDEEIIEIPDTVYKELGTKGIIPSIPGMPCKLWLRQALYGLKQSGFLWHKLIDEFLRSLGLLPSDEEPNLYIGKNVLLLLYVDDLLVAHRNQDAGVATIDKLMQEFRMVNLGNATKFIGMELVKREDGYDLHQETYISGMLDRYNHTEAHGYLTPMDVHVDLFRATHVEDKALDKKQTKLYQALIGSLMYAPLGCRPDIAFAVTTLSRFNAAPLQFHMTAACRVLRYLKATKSFGN